MPDTRTALVLVCIVRSMASETVPKRREAEQCDLERSLVVRCRISPA